MPKTILTILLLIYGVVFNLYSQEFPSDFWHKGKIVLVDGDTISAKLKYDLTRDLVQVEIDNKIVTVGAKKAHYFEIFDVTTDRYRQFYSIPYSISPGYKTPIFFEVVLEGKLTLLCREYLTKQTSYNSSYYWSGGSFTRTILAYEYYFLNSKGEITYFEEKKRDLLNIMKDRSPQIKQFIKEYNLKLDEKGDLARITAYYNGLLES